MRNLRRFAVSVALLALLAGPLMGCAIAPVFAGVAGGNCPAQMNHTCGSTLTAGSPLCCTVAPDENPYSAVRLEMPAPVWTPEMHGAPAAALSGQETGLVASAEGTLSPPGSPPASITVLRI